MQNQLIPVIAVQLECPKSIGWAVQAGNQSWHGKEINALIQCITQNKLDAVTFSLSLLLPLELGQGAPIKQKE